MREELGGWSPVLVRKEFGKGLEHKIVSLATPRNTYIGLPRHSLVGGLGCDSVENLERSEHDVSLAALSNEHSIDGHVCCQIVRGG